MTQPKPIYRYDFNVPNTKAGHRFIADCRRWKNKGRFGEISAKPRGGTRNGFTIAADDCVYFGLYLRQAPASKAKEQAADERWREWIVNDHLAEYKVKLVLAEDRAEERARGHITRLEMRLAEEAAALAESTEECRRLNLDWAKHAEVMGRANRKLQRLAWLATAVALMALVAVGVLI